MSRKAGTRCRAISVRYDELDKLLADIDGDGLHDPVWVGSNGYGRYAYTALSRGDGTYNDATGGRVQTGAFAHTRDVQMVATDFRWWPRILTGRRG